MTEKDPYDRITPAHDNQFNFNMWGQFKTIDEYGVQGQAEALVSNLYIVPGKDGYDKDLVSVELRTAGVVRGSFNRQVHPDDLERIGILFQYAAKQARGEV